MYPNGAGKASGAEDFAMPKRNTARKPEASPEAESSESPLNKIVELPEGQEADSQSIARWMSLADKVLGTNRTERKKA